MDKITPDFILLCLPVISGKIPSSAKRTLILIPDIWASLDSKVGHTICIVVKVVRFYNGVLDIEQFFA